MKQTAEFDFMNNIPFGFAYQRLIPDGKGHASDYEIVFSNEWFQTIFGLVSSSCAYTELEAMDRHKALKPPSFFEDVAFYGIIKEYKVYASEVDKWYSVKNYSPREGFFITVAVAIDTGMDSKIQALFDQNNDGVFILDLEGNYVDANVRAAEILGYSIEELKKRTYRDISAETTYSDAIFRRAQRGEKILPYERRFIRKDGEIIFVDINLEVIRDQFGEPAYIQSVIRDISERKQTEMALITLNKLQVLVSEIASSLVQVDRRNYDEKIESILDKLLEYFDVERVRIFFLDAENTRINSVYGRAAEGVLPLGDTAESFSLKTYKWWHEKVRIGETIFLESVEALPEEAANEKKMFGDLGVASLLSVPFKEVESVIGFILLESVHSKKHWSRQEVHFMEVIAHMLNDARKKYDSEEALLMAKASAEVANRAKTQFLANMSHEIRTPLNGILGFINLISETALDETQAFYIQHAKESGESLLAIVNDILDLSKIEAGKLSMESLKVNLNDLLSTIIENMKVFAKKRSIDIELIRIGNLPQYIWTDPVRLKQVLMNLLNNGIKFTEAGRVALTVKFKALDSFKGKLYFYVEDTGIGINEEKRSLIFKAFSQGDLSTTRKYGGTGLGLTISSKLVTQMGGCLKFESIVDKGTTFYFDIEVPFMVIDAGFKEAFVSTDVLETGQLPTYARVLVVEDLEVNVLLLVKMLEKISEDLQIVTAPSGEEAVKYANETAFDLILMDVQMPGMDGLEATRRIRKIDQVNHRHTPIVALTAGALEEEKQKCFQVGMDDFISKPIHQQVLKQIVAQYLFKKQGRGVN